MNDKQVQDLIRGQFMNAVLLNMWTYARASRGRVQQQGQQVREMPLILDIICGLILLGWTIILCGTLLLSLLGLFMLIFHID